MMPSSFRSLVVCFLFVAAVRVRKIQCANGYSTYDELKSSKSLDLKIQNTDCQLQGQNEQGDCMTKFTRQGGSCPFTQAVSQLFPSLRLKEITKGFINQEKFSMEELVVDTCESKEAVRFKLKTIESYDVVPKYIVLAPESTFDIEWKNSGEELKIEDMKVVVDGATSIGNDHAVKIKIEKPFKRGDYEITCVVGSVSIRDFLAKFDVDANEMKSLQASDSTTAIFGDGMTSEKQALGINTLNFQSPTIKGVFSPQDGYEITVKGSPGAPKLISEAKAVYVIVQDFKKPDADIPADAETFDTPAAALFCSYDSDTVSGILYSLTGQMVPPHMALIKDVNKVAITAATQNINFINTPELRDLVEEFVPSKGFDMIEKGLNVLHFTAPGSVAAQDEDKTNMKTILFRIEVLPKKISWTTPQIIQGTMKDMGAMVWPKSNGIDGFPIQESTKVIYDSIFYTKKTKTLNVKFNLTEKIDVLEGGLVSLLNTSMRIYSTRKENGKYRKWKLFGSGKEAILDELANIKVKNDDEGKLVVQATSANIFSMTQIRNRTRATYLPDDYAEVFNASLNFAIKSVEYRASFDERKYLRFTGKVDLTDNTALEIIYSASATSPRLKVGVFMKNHWLHETVNLLYQKEAMQIVWMKFDEIGVVFKKEPIDAEFANELLRTADGVMDSGIGMYANSLQLNNCSEAKFCSFLNKRYGDRLNVLFKGPARKDKLQLRVRIAEPVKIGEGVDLVDIFARIVSTPGEGDRVSLGGDVAFRRTGEKFKGSVFDDGSGKLMLKAGDHKAGSKDMFDLPYVEMKPMDILFEIPTGYVEIMEYKSRLHVGLPGSRQLEFSGGISRQYVGLKDPSYLRFFAAKTNTRLKNVYASFGKEEPQSLIKGAKFDDNYVVVYNSVDEKWYIAEADEDIGKGFYYIGTIALKSGGKFHAGISVSKDLQITTNIHLPPTVLGKVVTKEVEAKYGDEVVKEEKIYHANVSLAMYYRKDQRDKGPLFVVDENGKQKIKGYIRTIGLGSDFEMNFEMQGKHNFVAKVELEGKIFKEIQGKITLTSEGSGFPVEIIDKEKISAARRRQGTGEQVKEDKSAISASWIINTNYHLDLTKSAAESAGKNLKSAIAGVSKVVADANKKAADEAAAIKRLLDDYKNQQESYTQKMTDIESEIRSKEQNIDAAILDISSDCIIKCKTITIPDVEYKENCAVTSSHSIPCLQWSESKDKVVNVNCLIKCEARKISSSNSAYGDLKEIRTLLNRYKELKTLADNLLPLITVLEKGVTIGEDTVAMVAENTDMKDTLTGLSGIAEDQMLTISKLIVDSPIQVLRKPCLPFDLDFVLNTQPPKEGSGKHYICFNGQFNINLITQILRMSFPEVDKMYKVLEEAELRYVKLNAIKKRLNKAQKEMTDDSASRRSSIPGRLDSTEDAIAAQLSKTAKRMLPRFTVKGDRTVMGFVHYSPWALLARSNPFSSIQLPNEVESYDHRKFNGSSCKQARYVVGQYKDIIRGLHSVSNSYKRGKVIYQNYRKKVSEELKDSYDELNQLANKTNLRPEEVKDMFYWYDFTRSGMNDWLGGLSERLTQHNRQAMSLWRAEMKGIYGEESHIDNLADMGHDAYARSNIGQKAKTVSSNVLHGIRNEIKGLMKNPKLTLEELRPILDRLNVNVESLHRSSVTCY